MVPLLQLRAIPEEEQNLHPDEKGSEQQSLHQIIQQCRGPFLEGTMADELRQPRNHVNATKPVVGARAVGTEKVIRTGCTADDERRR